MHQPAAGPITAHDRPHTDRRYLPARESRAEAADAILGGLEYLVREAHAAGLEDLAQALTGVMLSASHWPRYRA